MWITYGYGVYLESMRITGASAFSINDGLYLQLASKAAINFGIVLASLFLTFPHVERLVDDSEEG